MQPEPSPIPPSERINAIDALRGIALFTILAVNLVTEFRVSIFTQFMPATHSSGGIDDAVEFALRLALENESISLFSFLFGMGLAAQFDRLSNNANRTTLLIRRLLILGSFGLVHIFLIWNGDILVEYAVAGFIALPFVYGPRWLPGAAAIGFFLIFMAMPWIPLPVPFPTTAWMANDIAQAHREYGSGSFSQVLAFRIAETRGILPLWFFILPRTVMLFLSGAFVWRVGIVQRAQAHRASFGVVAIGGLAIGAVLKLATAGRSLTNWPDLGVAASDVENLSALIVALGYGALVMFLATGPYTGRIVAWAGPLGRASITNYLLQSVIFGWIFYGYGLGLFDQLGATVALILGIAVYTVQSVTSAWWLKRHQFGPVEWVWRSLMYGQRQPMLRTQAPVAKSLSTA